jgi:hypothetical protein
LLFGGAISIVTVLYAFYSLAKKGYTQRRVIDFFYQEDNTRKVGHNESDWWKNLDPNEPLTSLPYCMGDNHGWCVKYFNGNFEDRRPEQGGRFYSTFYRKFSAFYPIELLLVEKTGFLEQKTEVSILLGKHEKYKVKRPLKNFVRIFVEYEERINFSNDQICVGRESEQRKITKKSFNNAKIPVIEALKDNGYELTQDDQECLSTHPEDEIVKKIKQVFDK